MAEKNDQKAKESMENKMELFHKKLPELLAIAKKKKNMLEYQEISDYFKEFNLSPEQIEKVLEYLADSALVYEDTVIIVEASKNTDFSYADGLGFSIIKEKVYKTNKHVFLEKAGKEEIC